MRRTKQLFNYGNVELRAVIFGYLDLSNPEAPKGEQLMAGIAIYDDVIVWGDPATNDDEAIANALKTLSDLINNLTDIANEHLHDDGE